MSCRIIICETLATNRIILKVRLGVVGYQVDVARSPAEAMSLLREHLPDAVILGYGMPDDSIGAVLRDLRALRGCEALPVMVLGGTLPSEEVAVVLQAGADCYMARPFQDQDFYARLRRMIRSEDTLRRLAPGPDRLQALGLAEQPALFQGPGRIALVTEKRQAALALRHQLAGHSHHQFLPLLPDEALSGNSDNIDVFVIDARLGAWGDGMRMLAELSGRSGAQRPRFAIRRLAGNDMPEYSFFDGGAEEVLTSTMCPGEIAAHLDRLVHRKGQLDQLHRLLRAGLRLATIDPLTGLDNRRSGMAQMMNLLRDAGPQTGQGVAVILVDIDRFKSVNDRFGHPAGDQVLTEVARRLRLALRPQDVLCRYGGEEFMAVLGQVTAIEARQIAQRLCEQVERHAVAMLDQRAIRVTISAGMAMTGDHKGAADKAEGLIEAADQALLLSKAAGRNKLTVALHAA
jgi:two-component system cell cycle response regulator